MNVASKVGRGLFVIGLLLLGICAVVLIDAALCSRLAIRTFAATDHASASRMRHPEWLIAPTPDVTLWSEGRKRAYAANLRSASRSIIAILRIPRITLEAPIMEGTDVLTLERGVGRIPGTAELADTGNLGIAGHRDSFFRRLSELRIGDSIELLTPEGLQKYVVDRILIVNPSDTSVLKPRLRRSLTLVTCYPFYFVGRAPKRYIVQAAFSASAN